MNDESIKQLIQLLEEMGATDIKFQDEIGIDTSLSFVFNQKKVEISGTWHNDDTAGLFVEITPASADNVILKITAPAECTNCHKKPSSGFLHFMGNDVFLCIDCIENICQCLPDTRTSKIRPEICPVCDKPRKYSPL